jgi:hypothetical protein
MIIRATAIVNDLTKVGSPVDALETLATAIYFVVMMAAEDEADANELMHVVVDALAKRMDNYGQDRETYLKTRPGRDKQARRIKAMLGMKP